MTAQSIIEQAATARDAAWGLLKGSAIGFTGADTPRGCLLASSAISCSAEAADVQAELATIRRGIETHLKKKVSRSIKAGEMAKDVDADAVAGHIMVVIQGMSTLVRDGASRDKLMRVARTAMLAWPR